MLWIPCPFQAFISWGDSGETQADHFRITLNPLPSKSSLPPPRPVRAKPRLAGAPGRLAGHLRR
eukprot:7568476-Alexandrium_andersonii.AAC.1